MKRMLLPLLMMIGIFSRVQPQTIHQRNLWAIVKAWPYPLPLTNTLLILPPLFSTNASTGLPTALNDPDIQSYNSSVIFLPGTLCFDLPSNVTKYFDPFTELPYGPCINLQCQVQGLFSRKEDAKTKTRATVQFTYEGPQGKGGHIETVGSVVSITGLVPRRLPLSSVGFKTPRIFPPCNPKFSTPPIWTGCQNTRRAAPVQHGFFFTPNFTSQRTTENFTDHDAFLGILHVNPFDNWLLFTSSSGYTNLQPLFALLGGSFKFCNWSHFMDSSYITEASVNCIKTIIFPPTPVCVSPPFMFLLTNSVDNTSVLNCSINNCSLSQCWNGTVFNRAVIMRIPTFLPVPVSVTDAELPVLLSRNRRDFGITAAVITAVVAEAAAAAVAAAALTTTIQTATTVNQLAENTATALQTQESIDQHLKAGILLVNQWVDLLQEQVDILQELLGLGCIYSLRAVCVTPIMYDNLSTAADLSRNLSLYLTNT
ncbi:uncharacterized protein LOC124961286 [Sciurus carolinensis]|uniref:uncharacterized protein LOC124961286 n=1 Tax=Sciurus carolinensis TaxID=30640 RepID=UPI001FB529FC|nr:uncharacterized protein LOC124961286 [Sciurus carolinensis]